MPSTLPPAVAGQRPPPPPGPRGRGGGPDQPNRAAAAAGRAGRARHASAGSALPAPSAHQPAFGTGGPARAAERVSRRSCSIAAGDSNKAIARALDLSPHTVKRHVANILDKLNLPSRVQAAAWWTTRQLVLPDAGSLMSASSLPMRWPLSPEPLLKDALDLWSSRALAAGQHLGLFAEAGQGRARPRAPGRPAGPRPRRHARPAGRAAGAGLAAA